MLAAHARVLTRSVVCSQGVARQSAEAVSVWLGGIDGQPQAQLDGFKSRALRAEAPAQRHLYVTEWRQLIVRGGVGAVVALVLSDDGVPVACERLGSCATCENLTCEDLEAQLGGGNWAVVAMAVSMQRARQAP